MTTSGQFDRFYHRSAGTILSQKRYRREAFFKLTMAPIMPQTILTVVRSLSLFLFLCLSIGCSGQPEKKYIPTAGAAREALEVALSHWKTGAKHDRVQGFAVPIDVFDARWQNGKKLESFEIIAEQQSDGPKIFLVKMKLDEDKAEQEVKYFIVGKDPFMIFREQDYQKASGTGG